MLLSRAAAASFALAATGTLALGHWSQASTLARSASHALHPRTSHTTDAAADSDTLALNLSASFIWHPSAAQGSYVGFRRTFALAPSANLSTGATLHLFADSRYLVWINGMLTSRGPVRFDPEGPSYDSIFALTLLKSGTNVLSVLAHNYATCGDWPGLPSRQVEPCYPDPSGRFMNHAPGLSALLVDSSGVEVLRTDSAFLAWNATRYAIADTSWGSISDVINAAADDFSWTTSAGFVPGPGWVNASSISNSWGPLTPRPIPPLREAPHPLTLISMCGAPVSGGAVPPFTLNSSCRTAHLSAPTESQAYIDALLHVTSPGVSLLFEVGERYQDLACGQITGMVTYSSSGAAGGEAFISSDTFGGRYVCVTFLSNASAPTGARVDALVLVERQYPYDAVGTVSAPSEPFLETLFQRSLRTVQVTSEVSELCVVVCDNIFFFFQKACVSERHVFQVGAA